MVVKETKFWNSAPYISEVIVHQGITENDERIIWMKYEQNKHRRKVKFMGEVEGSDISAERKSRTPGKSNYLRLWMMT